MRRPSLLAQGLLALTLFVALPAAAQIYQWRDAQGRAHYSDTPPPTHDAKTLRAAPRKATPPASDEETAKVAEAAGTNDGGGTSDAAPAAAGKTGGASAGAGQFGPGKADPAKPKTMAEKELEFRQRRIAAAEAEAKAEKERQQAAELARVCEDARGQLVALTNSRRLARYNSKGETELLDDATRRAEIERTQKFVDSRCK